MSEHLGARTVTAPRGSTLHARGWAQEAALRMLQNSLDPEVAERPEELVVYGGSGRAARDWPSFEALVATLEWLGDDETLLVQSGRPVGVLATHPWAPRVLIANANLVPDWATAAEFRRLEALGLTMYGQQTAGCWMYVGTQGILQSTYETFAAVADQRFGGSLAGTLTLTAGLGGMGGAQPLAVTMNGGVVICVEANPARVAQRLGQGYLDRSADSLDEALRLAGEARTVRRPFAIGLVGNAAELVPAALARGAPVDIVTDQTSAHDPLRYLPPGLALRDWDDERRRDPQGLLARARTAIGRHVEAMVGFLDAGAVVFDFGNSIRSEAQLAGYLRSFDFPSFVAAYLRPLFCTGRGPFRWVAPSGEPSDIATADRAVRDLLPDNDVLTRWLRLAGERLRFQGLPARVCWLGQGEREQVGLRLNEMVQSGALKAPVVIGRDHLDTGSVAAPSCETETMADGSDAIADWPLLNALVNVASGASWVSIQHGGGVGVGRSVHAGQAVVADGTEVAAAKLARVLTNDPATGVIRHAAAGYAAADRTAAEHGLPLPMRLQPRRPGSS